MRFSTVTPIRAHVPPRRHRDRATPRTRRLVMINRALRVRGVATVTGEIQRRTVSARTVQLGAPGLRDQQRVVDARHPAAVGELGGHVPRHAAAGEWALVTDEDATLASLGSLERGALGIGEGLHAATPG